MIEVVDGLDLSGVPIPFLEAHPFPAFVLSIALARSTRPKLVSRDTDVTVRHYSEDIGGPYRQASSSTVAWSNEKWLQLTQGRSLDDCFDTGVMDRLQGWIEGELDGDDSLFVLDMKSPAVTLHLAKTILPLTPPSLTHAFCIITSQARRRRPASTPSDSSSPNSIQAGSTYSAMMEPRPPLNEARSSFSTEATSSPSELIGSYFPSSSSTSSRDRRQRSKVGRQLSLDSLPLQMTAASEEMWRLMDGVDWSKTALGPRDIWSKYLDSLISVAFQSQTTDSIWLGRDLHIIYNKPYSALVGAEYAAKFGKPAKEIWGAIWDYIGPIADRCLAGLSTYKVDDYVVITTFAGGRSLEQYFTSRWVPITHKDGQVIGLFNQATETTDRILAERRLGSIRELSEQMLVARSAREFYENIVDVLGQNPKDAPFALAYSASSQLVDGQIKVELNLESSYNVPTGHPSAPQRQTVIIGGKQRTTFGHMERLSSPTLSAISALSSGSGRMHHTTNDTAYWPIQKALSTRQCVIIENCSSLVRGFPLCVWDEIPFAAIIVPICSDNTGDVPEAVLILGLSAQRPFDEEYDNWVHMIRSQLTSALTSVKAYEAEQHRLDDAARMERAKAAWFRGAAHDLRSPLTLINGPIEDLLDTNLTPSQKNSLVLAKRSTERLMRLVNALMDFFEVGSWTCDG